MKFEGDFVQLYDVCMRLGKGYKFYQLYNGFNYVHDYVDVRWVDVRKHREFVPKHKNVYISTWFSDHQHIAVQWAKRFPAHTFILGGPLYQTYEIRPDGHEIIIPEVIPNNVRIQTGIVEDLLKIPVNLKNWKLNFPKLRRYPKQYSYYTGIKCYWNGCTFCDNRFYRDTSGRRHLMYDLEPLWDAPRGTVFFSAASMTGPMLEDILPNLNYKDKYYHMYVRAGSNELDALKKTIHKFDVDKVIFSFGVEFPSDRMLKIMNKGVTLQEYIDMILFIREIGGRIKCLYITNWSEIIEEDLDDVRYFFDSINSSSKGSIDHSYTDLALLREVPAYQKINSNAKLRFFDISFPSLNVYQKKWNDVFIKILDDNGALKRSERNTRMSIPAYNPELYKKFIEPLDERR